VRALAGVHGVYGLSITERPSGLLVYLVLEEWADEDQAYAAFGEVRNSISRPAQMICVSPAEADSLTIDPAAHFYTLPV